jgi:1,4-alpha-glucan branching enzyme
MVRVNTRGEVEFAFFRPASLKVYLVGDFNGWHRTSLPMQCTEEGYWTYRLRLSPGHYQFKYLADGEWYPDYAAFGLEPGGLGAWNSVVLVNPPVEETQPSPRQNLRAEEFVAIHEPLPLPSPRQPKRIRQLVEA